MGETKKHYSVSSVIWTSIICIMNPCLSEFTKACYFHLALSVHALWTEVSHGSKRARFTFAKMQALGLLHWMQWYIIEPGICLQVITPSLALLVRRFGLGTRLLSTENKWEFFWVRVGHTNNCSHVVKLNMSIPIVNIHATRVHK